MDIVRRATAYGERVRPVGAGHSFTPLAATAGVLVSLERLTGVVSIDRAGRRAVVRAGTRLADLGEPLLAAGLALENQGDIDVQTVAGAIATGTHGTGATLGSLSSQVTAVRLVTGEGSVLRVGEDDADRLGALRVSLGALGIVTEVELRVVPAYRLHQKTWRTSVDEGLAAMPALVEGCRHFEAFWWPAKDRLELKTLVPTTAPPDPLPDEPWQRIDHSHRIFPSVRDVKFNEIEYSLAAERGPDCLLAVRARIRERHRELVWPVEYRTVAADDAFLSPAFGRSTVAISVHQDAALPFREFFADVEAIFREHGGRPHWGKLHSLRAEELAPLYPHWGDFAKVRRELDPAGRMRNEHLDRVLGM